MAGVINKLRSKAGLVVGVIGLALGAFILQEAIQNLGAIFSDEEAQTTMAVVYDERIDNRDYSREVERQLALFELYNQQQQTPQMREQVQQQVWEKMVQEGINSRQLGGLGLRIGDQELASMFIGPTADPIVTQNLGTNDPAQVQQIIQAGSSGENPRAGALLTLLEEYLLQTRLQERHNAMLRNAIQVSNARARRALTVERRTATGEVLAINYGTVSDTVAMAAITESDYTNYYNENRERFRQTQPQANVSYIQLRLVPTARDSAVAMQTLAGYVETFRTIENDSAYAIGRTKLRPSPQPQRLFDYQYRPVGAYNADSALIAGMATDSVYGPYVSGNSVRILKVAGRSTADEDQTVYIRHILVQGQDSATAVAQARSLVDSANVPGMDFGILAMRNTADPQQQMQQGLVGWLTPMTFGPDFYKEVRNGRPGQVLGPVRSPMGFHVVKIERRSTEVVRTAVIGYDIEPSRQTRDSLRRVAGEIMALMSTGVKLDEAIDSLNIRVDVSVTNPPLNPATRTIPGLGGGPGVLDIVRWAMLCESNNTPGDKVFETDNAFVVAYLNNVSNGDYQPMEAVREQIARAILNKKKAQIITERLQALMASGGDLAALKTAYGQGAIVTNVENVAYSANNLPGVGAEPRVVGALFGLQPNQNSQVVEGQFGVYVARLKAITEPQAPTDEQVDNYRRQLTTQQRTQFQQRATTGMREAARIRDFRYKFGI